MTANYNKKTGHYEVYDSQLGTIMPYPEHAEPSYEDALKQMQLNGEYCGVCKAECLVMSHQLCCHDMARYGQCQHPQ